MCAHARRAAAARFQNCSRQLSRRRRPLLPSHRPGSFGFAHRHRDDARAGIRASASDRGGFSARGAGAGGSGEARRLAGGRRVGWTRSARTCSARTASRRSSCSIHAGCHRSAAVAAPAVTLERWRQLGRIDRAFHRRRRRAVRRQHRCDIPNARIVPIRQLAGAMDRIGMAPSAAGTGDGARPSVRSMSAAPTPRLALTGGRRPCDHDRARRLGA